jgi:hypothetical protein
LKGQPKVNSWAIAFLVGGYLAISSPAATTQEFGSEQKLQEALEKAKHVRAIEAAFSRKHPHREVSAGSFLRGLGDEEMTCRIQYRRKFIAGTGDDLGKFSATLEPGIECSTEKFSNPECAEFRVSLEVQWTNPRVPLLSLTHELESAPISRAYFICETTPRTSADKASIDEAIRKGEAVHLNR